MYILGISAFYHDSAACLVKGGKILAAAQEERFTRLKHDHSFPSHAIEYCLSSQKISEKEIEIVAFYEKPILKFERILETYLTYAPYGLKSFLQAIPVWLKDKLWMKDYLSRKFNKNISLFFPQHHQSHAASAFFPSPFERAAFITVDGVGEWTTTSFGVGQKNNLEILSEIHFPHSLGLLYSAFTYYCGFKVNSGEYKLMGLAPYGVPKYKKLILDELIDLRKDGSFHLNLKYFNYCTGLKMINEKFENLFGGKARGREEKLTRFYIDIACSIQAVIEEAMLSITRHVYQATGEKDLCLAGGVALNCVANGKILRQGLFKNIWIQPAAGDAGGALGAALFTYYQILNKQRAVNHTQDSMQGSYLGPEFNSRDIKTSLKKEKIKFKKLTEEKLVDEVSSLINDQKVIGWFQGRMEFGPRALGNRSILADARSEKMQKILNLKIKFRESFRPFAPSVLKERIQDYFNLSSVSPYMLLVAEVKEKLRIKSGEEIKLTGLDKLKLKRSIIPAVTHVDYSARIQTVDKAVNPLYHQLIKKFAEKYGCSVIINTSFNVRGEPIVCTPEDALKCFFRTDMDYLALENYLIAKSDQKIKPTDKNWMKDYELD